MCELLRTDSAAKTGSFRAASIAVLKNTDKQKQKLTWVQQTALESRFERREELLSLVGSFQTKLQIFDGSFRFWEV